METEDSSFEPATEVERLRALAHCDVINEMLARRPALIAALNASIPRTAVERHVQETGHWLRFGCCASDDVAA